MTSRAGRRRADAGVRIEATDGSLEDGAPARVRLDVSPASAAGGGPIELAVEIAGKAYFAGDELDWLVTIPGGWAHLRGRGRLADGRIVPFRCDVSSASAARRAGGDGLTLRVYATGADPDGDGPILKLGVELPRGSVRIGFPRSRLSIDR